MRPDVSVIVPTRNRVSLLGRLLRQLAALDDGTAYEVIVIDEGSSDETPALLAGFAEHNGFRIIRHDDPVGLPAARNIGLRLAEGEYVAWIDDDDLTAPDRLARQLAALRGAGGGWSCAGRVDIDDELRVIGHMRCPDSTDVLRTILRSNSLPTAAQGLLVERALAEQVGGNDESFKSAEDWEFCIRLAAERAPHFLDEPLVGYRTGVESMSTNTTRMEESIRAVITKHAELYERVGVKPDWASIHESLMAAELLNSRWRAFGRAVRSLRSEPTLHRALRCPLVLAAPRWFAARSAARRIEQVPGDWVRQARQWLDAIEGGKETFPPSDPPI